jgi:hypothetical protein
MTEGVIPSLLHASEVTPASDELRPGLQRRPGTRGWDPENFAREQIRGLVRRVFFSNAIRPVRQVVLAALDPETELRNLCRSVTESLANQTASSVAIVGDYPRVVQTPQADAEEREDAMPVMPLHRIAHRCGTNQWLVPCGTDPDHAGSSAALHSYLGQVRREFEYSVVQAPLLGESDEAIAMAQFADGIILVLSARYTRRATARRVKNALEAVQARILGSVLCDRLFPIPDALYRRL